MLGGQRLYVQVWGDQQPLAYDFMAGVLALTHGWHPGMQLILALQVMVSTAVVYLIARRLDISEKTVKAHLTRVYTEIGVTDRTQAALWAQRNLAR